MRIEDAKFEPPAGREFGAKLSESMKEGEDDRFKLVFCAVKGGIDNFLPQELPELFKQV